MMAVQKQSEQVAFTYSVNFASAETKRTTWDKFAATVSRSEPFKTKEQSVKRAAVVGGVRQDERAGRAENVATRTILTLDYDNFPEGTNLEEIEFALEMGLDCAFVAYSTFRHTPGAPRVRVMAQLSREVSAAEYPLIVDAVAGLIGLDGLDACSKVINQLMFLASHHVNVEPWSLQGGAGLLDVDALGIDFGGVMVADEPGVFDLDMAYSAQPLDITGTDVESLLENYPAEPLDYDQWVRVGMALAHQHRGSDIGFDRWLAWSAKSSKHDSKGMRVKWRSFDGTRNPVTMASIIKAAGGLKGGAIQISPASDTAFTLRQEAEAVSDMESYAAFKERVTALSPAQLPQDIRSVLANEVHKAFGKAEGMGLRDIKTALAPPKGVRRINREGSSDKEIPEWLAPWVYYELDNEFVNTDHPEYRINSRAFDAKFDREKECLDAEMTATRYAIGVCHIETVARLYFMPDTDEVIAERNGLMALNTYRKGGVTPCATLEGDTDAQEAVAMFLAHVRNTIEDEREQTILLDWMAHVYRNPGQRVNWALLIWGVEGNGKTAFFNILQSLIGKENTKDISPSAISSQYNDWAAGGIVGCVEEIRIAGTNKWQVLDSMKPAISNDTLAIHPKGKAMFANAPNHCSYMMTTNHMDAVPMSQNDRRFCVLFSKQNTKEDLFDQHGGVKAAGEYFSKLFGSVVNGRPDAVARYLLDYKISDAFDHKGRAPHTYGLDQMRDANVSEDVDAFRSIIEDGSSPILNDKIICITELKAIAAMQGEWDVPKTKSLGRLLRDEGFMPIAARYVLTKGVKHYVWTRKGKVTDNDAADAVRSRYDDGSGFQDVPF